MACPAACVAAAASPAGSTIARGNITRVCSPWWHVRVHGRSVSALASEGTTTSTEPQHGDGDLNPGGEHDLAIHLDSGGVLTVLMLTNRST